MERPLGHSNPSWLQAPVLVTATAAIVALAVAASIAVQHPVINAPNDGGPAAQPATASMPLPVVPGDWAVYVAQGFIVAAPSDWTPLHDVQTNVESGRWLQFMRPNGSIALEVTTWPHQRALDVMQSRVLAGTRQPIKVETPDSPTILGQLVLSNIAWSSPVGSGSHQERKLFLQPSADLALEVHITPELVASGDLQISSADARVQDVVATHLLLARDTESTIPTARVDDLFARVLLGARRAAATADHALVYETPDLIITISTFESASQRRVVESSRVAPDVGISSRGLGNLIVTVSGGHAEQRFQLIQALDGLLPK